MDRLNEIKELWVEKIPFEAFWHEIEELRKETDAEGFRRGVEEPCGNCGVRKDDNGRTRGTGGGE